MSDPVAEFSRVAAAHPRCFWLDGGGARDWSGSRSLIGWLEESDVSLTWSARTGLVTRHADGEAVVVGTDIFEVLQAEIAAGAESDQWFGYFGYACRTDLPVRTEDPATGHPAPEAMPDALWMRPSQVRLFEHRVRAGTAAAPTVPPTDHPADHPTDDPADLEVPAAYQAGFAEVTEALHAGNSYEVNLTYRLAVRSQLDPATVYLRLREINPAPYAGFLQHDVPGHRAWLLSSSPERYALIDRERMIETKPIKGTTPRGADPEEDRRQRELLATEPKFRAENLMITDLLRNDLSMVCEVGTVTVPALMQVESYPSVHQLVSTVRGRLRDSVSTVAALRELFPAGSMTGAPKRRTMEVIAAAEASPRGVYSGAFGWISGDGRADLGVVIRSLTTVGDGLWRLGTGGGITVLSEAASEYAESRWKAERLLRVFGGVGD